jgi:hypothetical protein
MPRFLVQYTHVEETTYEQWVEAEDQLDALNKIEGEETFENVVNVQGLELKDYEVVEEQEEEY